MLKILAGENTVLEELAVNSDKALKPFAAVREHVAKFIVESKKTAVGGRQHARLAGPQPGTVPEVPGRAGAGRRTARASSPKRPRRRCRHLGAAAPGINQTFTSIPGFSASSEKFFKSTGQTSKLSGPALVATKPLLARLKKLGTAALPASTNLEGLFGGFRNTGGLERLLDFIFLGTGAANGYDSLGHFLRTEGLGTICTEYKTAPTSSCNRKLFSTGSATGNGRVGNGVGSGLGVERLGRHRTGHPGARDGAHAGGHQRRHARTGDRRIPR